MTREELEAIEKREREATAGPWRPERDGGFNFADARIVCAEADRARRATGASARPSYLALVEKMDDAAFIAAARTDIPALLAEVRRLREVCSDAAEELDRVHSDSNRHVNRAQSMLWEAIK